MLHLIENIWNPIRNIIAVRPTFDPRNDPELREVARRQDAAVQKIVRKKGEPTESVLEALVEESWASPDDYPTTVETHDYEREVMRQRLRGAYKDEQYKH